MRSSSTIRPTPGRHRVRAFDDVVGEFRGARPCGSSRTVRSAPCCGSRDVSSTRRCRRDLAGCTVGPRRRPRDRRLAGAAAAAASCGSRPPSSRTRRLTSRTAICSGRRRRGGARSGVGRRQRRPPRRRGRRAVGAERRQVRAHVRGAGDRHDRAPQPGLRLSPRCSTPRRATTTSTRQEFGYRLVPHAGDWREADTVRRAAELNQPRSRCSSPTTAVSCRCRVSYASIGTGSVIGTVIKAESDDAGDLIVRAYESAGRPAHVTIDLPVVAAASTSTSDRRDKTFGAARSGGAGGARSAGVAGRGRVGNGCSGAGDRSRSDRVSGRALHGFATRTTGCSAGDPRPPRWTGYAPPSVTARGWRRCGRRGELLVRGASDHRRPAPTRIRAWTTSCARGWARL